MKTAFLIAAVLFLIAALALDTPECLCGTFGALGFWTLENHEAP